VNPSAQPVSCGTSFYADSGMPLSPPFNGIALSSVSDGIPAGATTQRRTDAQPNIPAVTGWARADCTGPVKASALFRSYNGNVAQAEAAMIAMPEPATTFVTYADQSTGVAYANPSAEPAMVTFTLADTTGAPLGSTTITLPEYCHGFAGLGSLLGISSFQGSVTITSTRPILSLSLDFEAAPVFSALPPGQIDNNVSGSPRTYYFAHIVAGGPWRTTFTYVNQSRPN
jgi:hypothetical protein